MDINVKKRDGSVEPWSYDKLVTAIGKAGIPISVAEEMASKIEAWATQNSQAGVVSSETIKDKILEELKNVDPVASENFKVYKKAISSS